MNKLTDGKFEFKEENIIDDKNLFALIKSLTLEKIEKIEKFLKNQFYEDKIKKYEKIRHYFDIYKSKSMDYKKIEKYREKNSLNTSRKNMTKK